MPSPTLPRWSATPTIWVYWPLRWPRYPCISPTTSRPEPGTRLRSGSARTAHRLISKKNKQIHFYSFLKRSEEHTSELPSRENLVCRLLREKKKPQHHHHLD